MGPLTCFKTYYNIHFQGSVASSLESELEVLGSPEGEVHLAGMPGLLLDSSKARQEGPAALPVLCALRPSGETMCHILTGCSFSRSLWHNVLSWIRSTVHPNSGGT